MKNFPRRQVHLDFHTSPEIPGIGSRFDKKQFQEALKKGHLESITVFAKCHHGYCYYPTEVGTMHPGLDFDLTGAMVEAAHEIGVRAPIYITAGWCELDAKTHPEWIVRKVDGSISGTPPRTKMYQEGMDAPMGTCSWDHLCLNDGSYCQHIYDITEEVCKRYKDVDGLFYDICIIGDRCYCDECVAGMKAMGMDPEKEEDAKAYFAMKRKLFMEKCSDIMNKHHPGATIFFNSGGANIDKGAYHKYQTHFEMEDLPTAWGGYDAMPVRAKFFSRKGKPYLGMTGKFHLNWGEFGGFKCKEALRYEVAAMAMYGAGCSIGDHMHPDGEMEMQTYENIGYAYDYLEKIVPFCYGGESTANLGLVMSKQKSIMEHLSKLLLENQIDYDIVFGDFDRFDTVIVPENEDLDAENLQALRDYIVRGGKVLFYGTALIQDGMFRIDCGAEYLAGPKFDCDYIFTDMESLQELPNAPTLCMLPAQRIGATDGQVLAQTLQPYFSRTGAHFCGHRNTPHNKNGEVLPAIVRKGNVVYMAHSMPELYAKEGSLFHKRYFIAALQLLYKGGAFKVKGLGSEGRITMIHQKKQNRYCVNMVYVSPSKRGEAYIVEDIMPVYNVELTLNIPQTIKKAWLGVTGEELAVKDNTVIVPKLDCHASVVLEY